MLEEQRFRELLTQSIRRLGYAGQKTGGFGSVTDGSR